jgi:hypothetical protein
MTAINEKIPSPAAIAARMELLQHFARQKIPNPMTAVAGACHCIHSGSVT